MVLVYLLLSKDLERFATAQDHILHPNELPDAALTVRWVLDAVQYRVDDLRGTLPSFIYNPLAAVSLLGRYLQTKSFGRRHPIQDACMWHCKFSCFPYARTVLVCTAVSV